MKNYLTIELIEGEPDAVAKPLVEAVEREAAEAKLNTEMAEHTREVLLHAVTKSRAEKAEARLKEMATAEGRDYETLRGYLDAAEADARRLRGAINQAVIKLGAICDIANNEADTDVIIRIARSAADELKAALERAEQTDKGENAE